MIHNCQVWKDNRGELYEWFSDAPATKGFVPVQTNVSRSSRGVLRGIHYSLVSNGQEKLVTCLAGSAIDVVIDLRVSSPTFGSHTLIKMSGFDGKVVRVPKGFGHGFLTLEDNTIMGYLLSSPYNPEMEHAVSAFDPHLGIEWPLMDYVISEKDQSARNITELREAGILPA